MQKHERKAKRAIEKAGFRVLGFNHPANSHGEFTVEIWGSTQTVGCSSSPKNHDAMLNGLRRDLRSIKKQLRG